MADAVDGTRSGEGPRRSKIFAREARRGRLSLALERVCPSVLKGRVEWDCLNKEEREENGREAGGRNDVLGGSTQRWAGGVGKSDAIKSVKCASSAGAICLGGETGDGRLGLGTRGWGGPGVRIHVLLARWGGTGPPMRFSGGECLGTDHVTLTFFSLGEPSRVTRAERRGADPARCSTLGGLGRGLCPTQPKRHQNHWLRRRGDSRLEGGRRGQPLSPAHAPAAFPWGAASDVPLLTNPRLSPTANGRPPGCENLLLSRCVGRVPLSDCRSADKLQSVATPQCF